MKENGKQRTFQGRSNKSDFSDDSLGVLNMAHETNHEQHTDSNLLESESITTLNDRSSVNFLLQNHHKENGWAVTYQEPKKICIKSNLLRLQVKKGEYVYARPDDIVLIESCDHLVMVYLAFDNKLKKTIRSSTLKDFLLLLPQQQFLRLGRFYAINSNRLTGGNYNEQSFEFDFKISIKLKRSISLSFFNGIGN